MTQPKPTLAPAAQAGIDRAYALLEAQSGFRAREAQHTLSSEVATSLLSRVPMAAEAPTGTGKTLAYLVGAIAAQSQSGVAVVVSTATKALQQQILSTDLPRLVRAGLIKNEEVALAKGRSNYLCLRDAHTVMSSLQKFESDQETFLEDSVVELEPQDIEPLVLAFESGRWNGDWDAYEGKRPRNVIPISASSDTCTRRRCEHYRDCAYFKARKELESSKVVVVNHDLLLRDLLLAQQEVEPTLSLAKYNVVFDEAHHLPEKAISAGSAEINVSSLLQGLPKLTGAQRLLSGSAELERIVTAEARVTPGLLDRTELTKALRELAAELSPLQVREESGVLRFPRGELPGKVKAALATAVDEANKMGLTLSRLVEFVKGPASTVLNDKPAELARLQEINRRVLDVMRPLKALEEFNALASSTLRKAVWLFRKEASMTLHTAPLEGADVLNKLLWRPNDRVVGVSMVSATLRDLGGFERFRNRVGLPKNGWCTAMPYTFDYEASELRVPAMKATPKFQERQAYLKELQEKLPACINPTEGTLLLFPSWGMLQQFRPLLREHFGESIRFQGEQVVRMLLRSHCQAIDSGQGSILAGVATMAEGLDLPGDYCTHVVIMALPFAVPTDPVEEELAELLGKDYFSLRSLPDSMVKLTQMVGRLLRRESDRGRITVFDRRLASTSYGQRMLRSLPPFKKVIEPQPAAV